MTLDYTFLCLSLSVSGVISQSLATAKLSFAFTEKKKIEMFSVTICLFSLAGEAGQIMGFI